MGGEWWASGWWADVGEHLSSRDGLLGRRAILGYFGGGRSSWATRNFGEFWWGSVFLGTRKFGGEARAGHDIILGYDPGGAYLGPGGVRGELRI